MFNNFFDAVLFSSKRLFFVLCLLVLGSLGTQVTWAQEADSDSALIGLWKAQEAHFRPLIRIEQNEDKNLNAFFTGTAAEQGTPFAKTIARKDSLLLQLNTTMSFRGVVLNEGSVIKGEWVQGSQAAVITLERVDARSLDATVRDAPAAEAPVRPQHPELPYPYATEDITFQNEHDGVRLAGTLTLPEGKGPFPAVVLLTGTGDKNRDYEIYGHRFFLVLADYLTRQGVATLRYDRRGVGESEGSIYSAHLDDFARDAAAALRYLKKHTDVDAQNTGIIGHSIGTAIALRVNEHMEDAAFLALLVPPSLPGHDVFVEQHGRMENARGASASEVDSVRMAMRQFSDVLRMEADSTEVAAQIRSIYEEEGLAGEHIQVLVEANMSPWFREIQRYDPRPLLQKVEVPVFILFGTRDLMVPSDQNEPALRVALAESPSPDKTIHTLEGLNHWLQPAETGLPEEIKEIETTISPEVLNMLGTWLLAQTTGDQQRER